MTQIRKRDEINDFAKLITDWRSMAIVHAVYEHDSLRYASLDRLLGFSPTVLSQKLAKLAESGIIVRRKIEGAKEVLYLPTDLAKDVVCAYHILEGVSVKLANAHDAAVDVSVCRIDDERGVK
ncbi:MAG: hypothetical protein PVI21_02190 [Candidatus Woesebacteria bacterium]